jgi:HAAS domain-containing protein
MTADEYVRRVNYWLTDLPWATKKELLSELRAHLSELPQGTDLASLGTPEQYAADMRAAAGLDRRRGLIAFLRARRPRNVILTAVAVTVIALAIGAVAWIDSYQPLVMGNAAQDPLDSKPSSGAAGVTVVFREGRPSLYGVTIRNSGRFPVRILGVPRGVTDFFKAHLFVNKPNPADNEMPLERFRPFDLHPGETRWLVLKGVYACTTGMSGGGGAVGSDAIPVRFSFLWRTETTFVTVLDPLTITFTKKGCPPGGDTARP